MYTSVLVAYIRLWSFCERLRAFCGYSAQAHTMLVSCYGTERVTRANHALLYSIETGMLCASARGRLQNARKRSQKFKGRISIYTHRCGAYLFLAISLSSQRWGQNRVHKWNKKKRWHWRILRLHHSFNNNEIHKINLRIFPKFGTLRLVGQQCYTS